MLHIDLDICTESFTSLSKVLCIKHNRSPIHLFTETSEYCYYLHREADEFQCLILAPAAHDVRQGTVRIFVERCFVWLLFYELHCNAGNHKCQDSIHENNEL